MWQRRDALASTSGGSQGPGHWSRLLFHSGNVEPLSILPLLGALSLDFQMRQTVFFKTFLNVPTRRQEVLYLPVVFRAPVLQVHFDMSQWWPCSWQSSFRFFASTVWHWSGRIPIAQTPKHRQPWLWTWTRAKGRTFCHLTHHPSKRNMLDLNFG